MSVDSFFKLKEIDSLSRMRINQLRAKNEQEDRLSKLNIRRQEEVLQTAKLKQDLVSKHDQLADLEKKLKLNTDQRQHLIDLGGDEKKIQNYASEIQKLEEAGLLMLEECEQYENEIKGKNTFILGLDKTIQEIQTEIEAEVEKSNQEVSTLDMRIKLLLEELPDDFRSLLQRVSAKNLAYGPFTRVEAGSCYFCRYKLSRIEESEIDMQKNLKTCVQCGRIFLPYGAS